ncbi:hypothetical protein AMATHDRAFT_74548 [Amanita thiersii Skay4041]|uniref:Uncharacterized protein n=1 Tax=Amanita thiersii Skay4041 TaxID=703135 RepID=A0A2A9NNE2_9AGAR|nr:hypothetical protein AMATHDRAFT_74548 [Amanita thiersii Skay4041]
MVPFRVTAAAYHANASPSVSLERGAYRLRAPQTRSHLEPEPTHPPPRNRRPPQGTYLMRISLSVLVLIVLLTFACLSCFALAYHLYSTRWGARSVDQLYRSTDWLQVNAFPYDAPLLQPNLEERYMTYLPHSGFHNQRISLENALMLSYLLNRTLIIPPVRLGRKPLRYMNSTTLSENINLGHKEGLQYCLIVPTTLVVPPECFDYFDYTYIPWNWLVNLTQLVSFLPLKPIQLWGMSLEQMQSKLKLNTMDMNLLLDDSPYQYQFQDLPLAELKPSNKYLKQIFIQDLTTNFTGRLLQLGTLFGSSRLLLRNVTTASLHKTVRQNMVFSNPLLISIALSIRDKISSPYIGVQLRISEGIFETNSISNVYEIWWKLVHVCYGYSEAESKELERVLLHPNDVGVRGLNSSLFRPQYQLDNRFQLLTARRPACRRGLHTNLLLLPLNAPLYLSTDVEDPSAERLLSIFFRTFPCVLMLPDFADELKPLQALHNPDDGLGLTKFMLPFLDAMVMGHASRTVTTRGSTFGTFVEDVLWRSLHQQRG